MPEPKKFSHKGKAYEVMIIPSACGFTVRAYDQDGRGVGRTFSVTHQTEGKPKSGEGDPAVTALMQLAQEEIKKDRFKELKRPDGWTVRHLRKSSYRVSYKSFCDQEIELSDRYDHLDEAVEAAWVLLNAGIARMVDIPDPEHKGGDGGLRHRQIVARGKNLGLIL